MRLITWLPGKESPEPLGINPSVEAYQASMTTDFNWLHNRIFPHFFRQIQVEDYTLAPLQQLPVEASVVYVTPTIGQLEYNYFNYLYIQNHLPLPQLSNDLTLFFWRPWGDIKRLARLHIEACRDTGHLPSPMRTHLWERLIQNGAPTLINFRTSRLHDDLFWEDPQEDPLAAVIGAAKTGAHPVYCIPQDFIWDKHPERPPNALTLFLIGDRDKRGPIHRFFYFLLYYKRRAIVKFGTPLCIQDWLATQSPTASLPQLVQSLRADLFTQLRIERTAITGPGIKPRKWIIEQVIHSEAVQRCIYDLAKDRGTPVEKVQYLARRYAEEIAADPHHSMIEIAARLLRWALRTLYEGITVDEEGMQRIKTALGQGPVVLVPNHRSHMDYMLISTILYSNNVAVPFTAGGINMNFWPIGPIFRKCGAYFLRRSFGGNSLYKAVFQSYITELVRQGYCQEFFIEGTRSRTGKMAHPKLGMLSMLIESWRGGAAKDITFIPVSITYDQVMEVKSYGSELKGAKKASESARDILRVGSFFKRRWGRVYLNFGDPITLGATAAELETDNKPQLVQQMAKTIMYAINKRAVVTPMSVTAMVLLSQNIAMTVEEIIHKSRILIDYLVWKSAACAASLTTMPEMRLQESLVRLSALKAVTRHATPTTYSINVSHRNTLDYAKNTGIHFFVSIACVAQILVKADGTHSVALDAIDADYNAFKQLFAFEFNFSTRKAIAEHLRTLLGYLVSAGMVRYAGEDRYEASAEEPLHLFAGLLDNYLEAYGILFHFLRTTAPADASERHWIKLLIHHGRILRDQKRIRHEESVSKSIFQNGLLLCQELGVCEKTTTGQWHWKGTNSRFDMLQKLIPSFST